MLMVCSTHHRTSDLNNDMEKSRRELAELERTEAEEVARQRAESRSRYERKWEKFGPLLEHFLGLFPMLQKVDEDWRRDVFCGRTPMEEQTDQIMRALYAFWLTYSGMFKEKAEFLGRHLPGNLDESLDRLVRYAREGDRVLRAWEPPVLSSGYSFRAPALSNEAAGRLREMFPETK